MNTVFKFLLLIFVPLISCQEDEPVNFLQFDESEMSFTSEKKELLITLKTERMTQNNSPITIRMESEVLTDEGQFRIEPKEIKVNKTIYLTIPKNSTEASFKIVRLANPALDGNENVKFTIATAAAPLNIGLKSTLEVKF